MKLLKISHSIRLFALAILFFSYLSTYSNPSRKLSDFKGSIKIISQYDITMQVCDTCGLYTVTQLEYTAEQNHPHLLYFQNIANGCMEKEELAIYDDCYSLEEIKVRDFPSQFYKFINKGETITIIIIHKKIVSFIKKRLYNYCIELK